MNQGDIIYAADLQTLNSAVSYSGTLADSANHIQDSIGNDGYVYSHRPSGSVLFTVKLKNGLFGGGTLKVDRLVNGSWTNIYSHQFGWSTDTTVSISSQGAGEYHIYSSDNWQFAAAPWTIYCGQSDAAQGKYLTVWDDFKTSLNSLQGTSITAALCNAQRVGTLGTP